MTPRVERRWVIWFGLILMLVTTLPYFAGYFTQNQNWRYSGLALAEEDGYSYFAKMLSGAQGAWLFRTPYTLADQKGFLGFLPYMLLGKLTSSPGQHEQLAALFHLFRIAGGVLACLAAYDFAAIFIPEEKWRRFATVVSMVGGGLGGLSILGLGGWWMGPMPLEFYSPETFGFLGFLAIPHLAWARALLLWGLVLYLAPASSGFRRGAILAGVLWIVMGFFQPLVVIVGWAVLGAHVVGVTVHAWRSQPRNWSEPIQWGKRAALVGVISSPVVIYNFVSFQFDPFLKVWQKQNYLPSPPVTDYLLAYGVLLPLVILGIIAIRKSVNPQNILLLAWVGAFPVLAYLPYNLQRRLPEGLWVALAVLAVYGLRRLTPVRLRLAVAWMGIGFLPAIILMTVAFRSATTLGLPSFRPSHEVSAFAYLDSLPDPRPAVLAAFDTSTALPAYSGVRVPIGHGPESLGGDEFRVKVNRVFDAALSDADRRAVLSELEIDYVFYGPLEKKLGDFDLGKANYLKLVFQEGEYSIYQVEAGLAQ